MVLYITFLDIFDRNFGVTNTRKCANLHGHFSHYALLMRKKLNVLLTCLIL